jgi:hypothetical protein
MKLGPDGLSNKHSSFITETYLPRRLTQKQRLD